MKMKNRFNINEEEKNRIRGLHGIGIIKEQWTEIKLDEVQDKVEEQSPISDPDIANPPKKDNVKRITPDEFIKNLKQFLWGTSGLEEAHMVKQDITASMTNENEIRIHYDNIIGKDVNTEDEPKYIIKT